MATTTEAGDEAPDPALVDGAQVAAQDVGDSQGRRVRWGIGTALVALWWLSVVSVDAGELLHGVSGGGFSMTMRGYVTFLVIVFVVGPLGLWFRKDHSVPSPRGVPRPSVGGAAPVPQSGPRQDQLR
ncbi:MAG: hypothetical protein ACYC0H_05210 [Solirubrobacteraceae bacterium]